MITIPILLFLLLAFGFWILTDSKLHLWIRSMCVIGLFGFSIAFWQNVSTFLGWPASGSIIYNVPVTIYGLVVSEPTDTSKGGIYATVEQAPSEYKSAILRFFGYPIQGGEPRLYRFDYDRKVHEELQKEVMNRLQKGQRGVRGMFKDPEKGGDGEKGGGDKEKGSGDEEKGDKNEGSESQESKSDFWHNLIPEEEHNKNDSAPKTKKERVYLV